MSSVTRADYRQLKHSVSQRLQQAGLSEERADIETEIMLEADLAGVPSHGVAMLARLLSALADGRVSATPAETSLRQFGAISLLDCGNGPGRYSALLAMNRAIEQAREFGIGICLAKRTSHWGRAGAYVSRAARQGFIGICSTNAIPTMAAWGTQAKVFGNNPLAIGVPGTAAERPVVLDMAMSQASVGKIATSGREGAPLPKGLGFDSDGNPSADPAAILAGAVAAMGDHKGAGLALMLELLTAALAGADFTHQLAMRDEGGIDANASKVFIAINIREFIDPDEFSHKVAELFSHLRGASQSFQYPGERGWLAHEKNLIAGVPLHADLVQQLAAIGIQF